MGAHRLDADLAPAKEFKTGNPAEWLIGMDVERAKTLLGNIGCSLRIHTRQGQECLLPKDERIPKPFRWNVDVSAVEKITHVYGRGLMPWRKLVSPRNLGAIAVMGVMETAPPTGMTVDEVVARTGRPVNSIATRVHELVKAGVLEDTGTLGVTRAGKSARNYKIASSLTAP